MTGVVSTAADQAFDYDYAVIAPNGNYGVEGPGSVRAPAVAHKVIGVGAVDVATGGTLLTQSTGPTPDGRIKPDIQGPTNTTTASNAGFTALRVYRETSGAAPYIAGAAPLVGYWRNCCGAPAEYMYTRLLNWGTNVDDASTNNSIGTGLLRLPSANGTALWGGLFVTHGNNSDVGFTVPANSRDVRVVLWWAEDVNATHSDVNLQIIDPAGVVRAQSQGTTTVFEKTMVAGPVAAGTWTIRGIGASVVPGGMFAYYDIHVSQ